ncbi:MAG: DUF4830 domain-containing protein [Clostridia bacterium]|nr:DUF4830 domain-containing protein [Clostridia bacterium]
MFIYSAKMNKKKLAMILVGVAAAILALVFILGGGDETEDPRAAELKLLQKCRLATNEDRLALLTDLGWEVAMQPEETREVRIPNEFSDVYARYNELQKEQGLDLAAHKGETVMRYTYLVVNHPSGENHVRATLLVKGDRLIGGDICSAKMDGFMHTLLMPADESAAKTPVATTPAVTTETPVMTQNVEPTVGGDESAFPTD